MPTKEALPALESDPIRFGKSLDVFPFTVYKGCEVDAWKSELAHKFGEVKSSERRTVRFATRLIQRLVTSNPSPAYVKRVATVFNDDGSAQHVRGNLQGGRQGDPARSRSALRPMAEPDRIRKTARAADQARASVARDESHDRERTREQSVAVSVDRAADRRSAVALADGVQFLRAELSAVGRSAVARSVQSGIPDPLRHRSRSTRRTSSITRCSATTPAARIATAATIPACCRSPRPPMRRWR